MKNKCQTIILFGISGSGKGTQTKLLAKKFGWQIIEAGFLIREKSKSQNALGKKLNKIQLAGRLVPENIIYNLIKKAILAVPKNRGLIIDGYPRSYTQARKLMRILKSSKRNSSLKAIWIYLPKEVAKKRLLIRQVCSSCGHILAGLKKKNCPMCGRHITKRADQTTKAIARRIKWFDSKVKPAIDYFAKQGILIKVSGLPSRDKINRVIINKLFPRK
ncbi:MAG: hypothetical protein ACD_68C00071G0004 [uncultured bacterium]|nr:MAG: hypothetical protein ACD_68C00071G0004 [uncultured bacterium]